MHKTQLKDIQTCANPIPGKPVLAKPVGLRVSHGSGSDGGTSDTEGVIADGTGKLSVRWANAPYMAKQLDPDRQYLFKGRLNIKDPAKWRTAESIRDFELGDAEVELVTRIDEDKKVVNSSPLTEEDKIMAALSYAERSERQLRKELQENNTAQTKKIFWYVILALVVGWLFYVLIVQGNLFKSGDCTPNAAGESPGTCT